MKTDRMSLAFARICFFVMLFISTACNKMDRTLLKDDFSEARPAAVSEPAAAATAQTDRLLVLEGRVAQLESELKRASLEAQPASVSAAAYWD